MPWRGTLILGTWKGIWRLTTPDAAPELVAEGMAQSFELADDALFLETEIGVWYLAAPDTTPVRLAEDDDLFVKKFGGALFVGTDGGIWRIVTPKAAPERLAEGWAKLVEEHSGALFLGTSDGIWSLSTPDAAPKKLADSSARFVEERGGALFLGTSEGIWLVATPDAVPRRLAEGWAQFVDESGGVFFLGTDEGVWRLETPDAASELLAEGRAVFIEESGGAFFLGTDEGVWRLATPDAASERLAKGSARFVEERGDTLFLGTSQGIWRLATPNAVSEKLVEGVARFAEARDGIFLLGTDHGVSRIRAPDGTLEQLLEGGDFNSLERDGAFFLWSNDGIWRLATPNAAIEKLAEGSFSFIKERQGALFWGASEGIWRVATSDAAPRKLAEGQAWFVEERGGALFLGTSEGIWRVATPDAASRKLAEGKAKFVEESGGAFFLGTNEGVWRLATPDAASELLAGGSVEFIEDYDGALFLGTSDGISRVYDVTARVTALSTPAKSAWWERSLSWLPPNTLVGPLAVPTVSYQGADAERIVVPASHFEVILAADSVTLSERRERNDFQQSDKIQSVPIGFPSTLHVAIRDSWGNEYEYTLEQFVLPTAGAFGALLLIVPPVLLLLALLAAPYLRFCHSLIMNPFLRGIGSFGVVPLVLTLVPLARRHLLRRYRRALLASDDIKGWAERFVPPEERFTAAAFAARLGQRSRLLIVGVSGVGKTAFLWHLTACAAEGDVRPGGAAPLPIYLPLGRYAADIGVEAMIRGQLENLGELHDEQFVDWLIKHGGFLLLFDGLNELGDARRDEIVTFVEQHSQHNWVVATSQDAYARQFGHWGAVETMPKLTRSGIEALLRHHLGEARAASLVATLDEQQTALLALPQNLELALELAPELADEAAGLRLPDSEEGLFRAVFEQQFAAWREAGTGDFIDLLTADAYAMLRDRAPATLPPEIASPLIERKLMRQLGDAVYFRHDTLRGYAASAWLAGHWRTAIEQDGAQIDANWDAMLRFTTARLLLQKNGAAEVEALLFALLERAPDRSAVLFAWLEQEHADAVASYRDKFDRAFGEVTRTRLTRAA